LSDTEIAERGRETAVGEEKRLAKRDRCMSRGVIRKRLKVRKSSSSTGDREV